MPAPQEPRSPRPETEYTWQGDWARPTPPPEQPPRPAPTDRQRRQAARRRREMRRRRRRAAFLGTAAGILVLSGIITLILPKSVKGETEPEAPAVTGTTQLVAPLPYAGTNSSDTSGTVQTLNWGTVGPQQQSADTGYTYTATPQKSVQLGEFGRVSTSWFADAAFLGDSLTAGFCANEYNIDVGGALICGYRSISPNTIVNRTTVTSPDRGEEVAIDVLVAKQPAKLYILLGTNALVQTGNEDSFINYYARMLDDLRAALPNTTFYVQSILCATQETVEDDAPGLSPDHIGPGEHKTFEEYRSWKGQLFKRCDVGVVNIDDENTEALLEGHTCKLVTYGIHAPKVDYRASEQYRLLRNKEMLGVEFTLTEPDGHTLDVQVGMPGLFSIYNALATIGVGKVLGLADAPIHEGLKKALVKGRVELVPISHKFTILIDYAHNEAATESLIETLREYNPNRLVVVFGCGGNRSKLRRYGMGEVCAKLADFSILTEDNNRFEKVEDIIADIKTGMAKGNPDAKYVEIPDRLDALHYAIDHAQEGDLIAVIGKGHEAYRDREGVKTPFLERELIEEYAAETGVE